MKLHNMKMDPAMADKLAAPSCCGPDAPAYPWGLELSLNDEVLTKLGLTTMPEVGETLVVLAKARVTRCSSNETAEGGKRRDCTLQITDLGVEDAGEKLEGAADALYKG